MATFFAAFQLAALEPLGSRAMGPDLDARWAFARNAEALVGNGDGPLTDDVLALLQRINAQVRCAPLWTGAHVTSAAPSTCRNLVCPLAERSSRRRAR